MLREFESLSVHHYFDDTLVGTQASVGGFCGMKGETVQIRYSVSSKFNLLNSFRVPTHMEVGDYSISETVLPVKSVYTYIP